MQPIDSEIGNFLDRCTSCGSCAGACTFLNERSTPDQLIARRDQDVFLCTGCGACADFCPEGLQPSDALLQAKYLLLKSGEVPERVSKAVCRARRYARWGHSVPFAYYSRIDTVFWPGCSLSGMSPELVLKTRELLAHRLGREIGIALDCCANPEYQSGAFDGVRETSLHIKGVMERKGIKTVITACTNCLKMFHAYLPSVKVVHVLDRIPHAETQSLDGKACYLHHPCPTYQFTEVQQKAADLLGKLGPGVVEQTRPQCCGFGGNMHAISPESADKNRQLVLNSAGNTMIVTYCMSCKERFLEKGKPVSHLLELLVPCKRADKPLSAATKWFNRFLLAQKIRLSETFIRRGRIG